ncbi:MAG: ABC transporter ATP-binding protein [Desulfurococcaceae archaeon]|uniref:ABC transporter ATP-binding protein n=1 Tax=Staphylothermus marinus TaxID=2280 RepID=A0A7C4H8Q1_STAMA
MSDIVKLINVWKIYRSGVVDFPALRGVNLFVKRGEFISIMGPSGSGKTTLLNMIGLLDKPTRGKIYIDGIDTSTIPEHKVADFRNRKIGFVFQHFSLINRLTVYENIELPLIPRGISPSLRKQLVKKALLMIGGEESWLNKKPSQLSGGQQQRVSIARAIVGRPEILLADEPTGNLDRLSAKIVVDTFVKLNEQGLTIILVTHDPEVAHCSDKILIIRDGSIIGEKESLKNECILNKIL